MKNIKHLLDVVDQVRDHTALGLMSDPGLSKTAQVKQWAEEHGRRYCELIISQRMPSEISGMPMPVTESRTMEVFDFTTLLELRDGDVLAFDEFTNGNIQTLNACLTLIQERTMLSGKKLPSLLIVAMGNPQGRCELLPQTKQRFWWVDVTWDADTWRDYMKSTWGISVSKKILDLIAEQYKTGFPSGGSYNYHTPRTMENLLRIAQNIECNDDFWNASDVGSHIISGLYESIKNIDTFTKIKSIIMAWASSKMMEPMDTNCTAEAAFYDGLTSCGSMSELKEFLLQAEHDFKYDSIYPEFVEFLENTGLDEEAA